MEGLGMPYFAANWTPLVSGWPVTRAVILTDGELAHASMKAVEMAPMPTTAKPTGRCGEAMVGCANAAEIRVEARASVESLAKSRRFNTPSGSMRRTLLHAC